jgi:hypothetical protein
VAATGLLKAAFDLRPFPLPVFFTGKDTLVFMAYQHDQPVLLVGEEHSEEH